MTVTVLVENEARPGLVAEHGLSLLVDTGAGRLLFDTGAGAALERNAAALGIAALPETVVLSHGHNDHTGGLPSLSEGTVYVAPGVRRTRFSLHPGNTPHDLTMPATDLRTVEVRDFLEVVPGAFATGPIPRRSGEDAGGPFFFDRAGREPDAIQDEQALLLAGGVLVQGCCHAGIVNTLERCRERRPDIPVRAIVGGLHLLRAGEDRLERTADYLRRSGVRELHLMHCTGAAAVDYLRAALPDCRIETPRAGDVIELPERPAPKVRLAIFDFDGTLGDTRRNIVLTMRDTMRELGLPSADGDACAATIGLRLRDAFARLLPGAPDETLDRCVSVYRRIFDEKKKKLSPRPFPGAAGMLSRLRAAGVRLAIASSRSSFTLAPLLRDMGLDGTFDAVVCGDGVKNPKPAPDAVLEVLRRTDVPAAGALVVGDMPVDIEMGRAAGVRTCGVLWGNATRERLAAAGADVLAASMDDIVAAILP